MKDEKILQDEILSEEQLDQVAGGSTSQTSMDSKFLNVLLHGRPFQCDRYGEWRIANQHHDLEIVIAWASVGVTAVIRSGNAISNGALNHYFIDGEEYTRRQAYEYAQEVVGKHLTRKDWDW